MTADKQKIVDALTDCPDGTISGDVSYPYAGATADVILDLLSQINVINAEISALVEKVSALKDRCDIQEEVKVKSVAQARLSVEDLERLKRLIKG